MSTIVITSGVITKTKENGNKMTDIEILILAFFAWVPLTSIVCYTTGRSFGYHKGRRKGLHDGWLLGQGGDMSPGLSPLEAWDMPIVFPDKTVYRSGDEV